MKPIKQVTDKQIALAKSLLNQIHVATKKDKEIEKKLDILNNIIGQILASNSELCFALDLANMKKAQENSPGPKPKNITPQRAEELRKSLQTS